MINEFNGDDVLDDQSDTSLAPLELRNRAKRPKRNKRRPFVQAFQVDRAHGIGWGKLEPDIVESALNLVELGGSLSAKAVHQKSHLGSGTRTDQDEAPRDDGALPGAVEWVSVSPAPLPPAERATQKRPTRVEIAHDHRHGRRLGATRGERMAKEPRGCHRIDHPSSRLEQLRAVLDPDPPAAWPEADFDLPVVRVG